MGLNDWRMVNFRATPCLNYELCLSYLAAANYLKNGKKNFPPFSSSTKGGGGGGIQYIYWIFIFYSLYISYKINFKKNTIIKSFCYGSIFLLYDSWSALCLRVRLLIWSHTLKD